jgi:aldose 1-epimerase
MLPSLSEAAPPNYAAERRMADGVEVIRLADARRQVEVWVAPSLGNNAYEMKVNGKRVFWSPYQSVGELKAKPAQLGNPFLAPWCNRIDGGAYWANGRKYLLNPDLKNFRYDAYDQPIHGLVVYADWQVVSLKADSKQAELRSRLEFWRRSQWMAQFPFAHTYEMTYRLADGVVEVETAIENHAAEPMPLSLGYHTYYQVNDAPRDDWKVYLPAREHVVLGPKLTPTGEIREMTLPKPVGLAERTLDDVFTGLERDSQGHAVFYLQGQREKVLVRFGPRYKVAVVYAPKAPGRDFVCFEPMAAVTNAFNLAQAGKLRDPLPSIPPGGKWRESFWIATEGF